MIVSKFNVEPIPGMRITQDALRRVGKVASPVRLTIDVEYYEGHELDALTEKVRVLMEAGAGEVGASKNMLANS